MKIDDIAKQLANKVNQEHYIKHYLEKVQRGAYNKGVKDAEAKQLILSGVVSCVCKIPEPRLKVSENGTYAYCNNCAKTYWQK